MTTKLDLRVCDLHTGDTSAVSFAGEAEAAEWLRARPKFTEVLGVLTVGLPAEVDARLRAELRPLDAEESELREQLDAAIAGAARARQAAEQARLLATESAHRETMRTADPSRPMELHWTFTDGLSAQDPSDPRPISDEVRAAVLAWVRERDEWVESRGQVVGDAKITVWPGAVPEGQERVKSGTFIPVTAPAKG